MLKKQGFTLIEMLVVISIVTLLSSLLIPGISKAKQKANRVREQAAGRSLAQAYMLYATEHNGKLMPGYADQYAEDADGTPIPHPINARYPWRLAPYLNYNVAGVFHVHPSQAPQKNESRESFYYRVSVYPALGMNVFFVGGDMSGTTGQGLKPISEHEEIFGTFCVTRINQAASPSTLITFASSQHRDQGRNLPGFHKITSPRFTQSRWSQTWDAEAPPSDFGFVDLRWNNKAVTVMLDGSVRLMDESELRDMRHWSNQAAQTNDPDWTLGR